MHSELGPTGSYRAHEAASQGQEREKKKTTHPGEQLFQLLRRQTLVPGGIFQMTPCMAQGSSLSFKRGKAKASLADMHGAHKHVTQKANTHCRRRKVYPFPPALQLRPPFSSCHSCHCGPEQQIAQLRPTNRPT